MYRDWLKCDSGPARTVKQYNKCVKIGNWFEERAYEEEMIKDYLYKRDNNMLTWQKMELINRYFLTLVDLSYSTGGFVKYGDKVMLINTPILNTNTEIKPLCVHVPNDIIHAHCIDSNYINTPIRKVTASNFIYAPTKISTFVIRGRTAANDGQVLRYGEPFLIYNNDEKLMLTSVKQTPLRNNDELTKNNAVLLVDRCGFNCCFKTLPFNSNLFLEMEGQPVPANTRVLINHIQTNQNLCMEDTTLDSVFGGVNEVSCKTRLNHHRTTSHSKYRTTTHPNHWCFYLDSIHKENFPITLKPFN